MINVIKHGIILSSTNNVFECEGVLNPAVIKIDNTIHMFYRSLAKGNYSTIGYCKLSSPLVIEQRNELPILFPESDYEFQGLEDPRIVKIDDIYYLTYTAYDGHNALGALATSKDLVNWDKHGILVPRITFEEFELFVKINGIFKQKYIRYNDYSKSLFKLNKKLYLWDKNFILFPRKINNNFCFIHRIKPDIQIVVNVEKLEDLTIGFWRKYFLNFDKHIMVSPKHKHEVSYVGGGCPPIETDLGWLMIYHSVHDTINGYVYSACAALFDIDNPQIEIARLPYPLFYPEKEWELKGRVDNVCFPTATLLENDTLYIYYGAADERIAVASLSLKDLLNELILYKF